MYQNEVVVFLSIATIVALAIACVGFFFLGVKKIKFTRFLIFMVPLAVMLIVLFLFRGEFSVVPSSLSEEKIISE